MNTFVLDFVGAPEIPVLDQYRDALTLHTHKSVIIEVPFIARPPPKVTWTYNNGPLPDPARIIQKTIPGMTTLSISQANRSDAGQYSLVLENAHGVANFSVIVQVLAKPGPPENVTNFKTSKNTRGLKWMPPLEDGGTVVLNYIVEKREGNKGTWEMCGATNEREIVISNIILGKKYSLRVSAENAVGVGEAVVLLLVTKCRKDGKWKTLQFSKFIFEKFLTRQSLKRN